jgi:hypothetical protein
MASQAAERSDGYLPALAVGVSPSGKRPAGCVEARAPSDRGSAYCARQVMGAWTILRPPTRCVRVVETVPPSPAPAQRSRGGSSLTTWSETPMTTRVAVSLVRTTGLGAIGPPQVPDL